MEEKLTLAYSEVQQLKNSLRQYEGLVDTYKDQVCYIVFDLPVQPSN